MKLIAALAVGVLTMGAVWYAALYPIAHPEPKHVLFHIKYGAYEDMFECPGTPDRVVSYTPLKNGGAIVECVI